MKQKARYSRQILLPEIGIVGQDKLSKASVLVVGVGGLGCPVSLSLVLAGVGKVTLVDGDQVEISNLQRQMLFTEEQVGQNKARAAAVQLQERNNNVQLCVHETFITPQNARKIMAGHDLIVDSSDNFPTRYLLSDVACAMGIPVVSGALQGFQAQVTVLNYLTSDGEPGPDYRSLFPQPPKAEMNCQTLGMLGSVSGWCGMVMANEALKIIIGHGKSLSGKIMLIDALNNEQFLLDAHRDPLAFETGKQNGQNPEKVDYGLLYSSDELEISADKLRHILHSDKIPLLLDIREKSTAVDGLQMIHLPGSKLVNNTENPLLDQDVILICDFGGLSLRLAHKIKSKRQHRTASLRGGLLAWQLYKKEEPDVH